MNLFGSICLSDIDQSLITEGKDGKKYVQFVINFKRNGPDQFGYTHYIKTYRPKAAMQAGVQYQPNYIGKAKPQNGIPQGVPNYAGQPMPPKYGASVPPQYGASVPAYTQYQTAPQQQNPNMGNDPNKLPY